MGTISNGRSSSVNNYSLLFQCKDHCKKIPVIAKKWLTCLQFLVTIETVIVWKNNVIATIQEELVTVLAFVEGQDLHVSSKHLKQRKCVNLT